MMASGWTEERVENLKTLWADGRTCSEIAHRLGGGLTRSAVIGKVRRLKLPNRAPSGGHSSRRRRAGLIENYTGRSLQQSLVNIEHAVFGENRPRIDLRKSTLRASLGLRIDGLPLPTPKTGDIARVSVMDLKDHQCKWPVGDPAVAGAFEPLFCGSNREPGKPYCLHHVMRAEAPVPVRERRVRARELQVA